MKIVLVEVAYSLFEPGKSLLYVYGAKHRPLHKYNWKQIIRDNPMSWIMI